LKALGSQKEFGFGFLGLLFFNNQNLTGIIWNHSLTQFGFGNFGGFLVPRNFKLGEERIIVINWEGLKVWKVMLIKDLTGREPKNQGNLTEFGFTPLLVLAWIFGLSISFNWIF